MCFVFVLPPPQVLYAEECQTGARSHAGFDREVSQILLIYIYFPPVALFPGYFQHFSCSSKGKISLQALHKVPPWWVCCLCPIAASSGHACLWGRHAHPASPKPPRAEKCSPKTPPFMSLLCCPVIFSPTALCFWLNTETSYNPFTQTIFVRNYWFWSSWGKKAVRKSPPVYTNKLAFEIIIAHRSPCWLFRFFFQWEACSQSEGSWCRRSVLPAHYFWVSYSGNVDTRAQTGSN